MKTFQPKKEVKRNWHLLDAKDKVLGRLASSVAILLMGKHKPTYSSHMDSGDYVVIINVEKVKLTGKKTSQKVYRRHSGYPGGFKEVSFSKMITEHPERVIQLAVSRMLPKNRLQDQRIERLKLVVGDKNPYNPYKEATNVKN